MIDDALSNARAPQIGYAADNKPLHELPWFMRTVSAFLSKPPPPRQQYAGAHPNIGGDRALQFIPPLALFNDASQWVNRKMFNRPMSWSNSGDSGPILTAQYFTPPPQNASNLSAGNLNLQRQYGTIAIQAQRLTEQASNYFGG